jgi:choline dehydrogenase-like flavoprotein
VSALVRGERPGLTRWEQILRGLAALLFLISVAFAVTYLVKGFTGDSEYPYTTNSVAKDFLLAGLAWLVYWDVRRWAQIAVPLIVLAHALMPVVLSATWLWGHTDSIAHTWGWQPSTFRWTWMAADVFMVTAFTVSHWMAVRSRYDLRYLPPSAFRALMALSEVLVLRGDREIAPAEVAGRVDHYLASFRAREKWKARIALIALTYYPMLMLRPPFYVMSADKRQAWLQKRFIDDVSERLVPEWLRTLRQGFIRIAQQFCFIGYYGDERAAAKAGYIPFSKRKGKAETIRQLAHERPGVTCMNPRDIPAETVTADVVIVGSGAGGATLAYELARRGREVLILERGAHVDPRDFTEDEPTQLSNLYADGALTLSTNFRFQVAQGMCVGGSTVVNNAVCFDLPERVLGRWNDEDGLNAGLKPGQVGDAFDQVRKFLHVDYAHPGKSLSPGAVRILEGLRKNSPWPFKLVECNMADCLGCGYCNIGCAFGKKLSALDWTLPIAQLEFRGAVRVLADCEVSKVQMRDNRATGVKAALADGRNITVQADTVVLSAGAIASSLILQRSGLGEGRAGKGLAFNMGSPMTLDFPEKLHAERGMQITHYLEPTDPEHDGMAFETWFNPIISQSLFMPGWFEEHWQNMRRYPYMTCLGVVVGTGSYANVRPGLFGRGVTLDFTPSNDDFVKLKLGLQMAGRIGLQAGAKRVLPSTFRTIDIRNERDLTRIENEIGDDSDVQVNSAHPQGGNPMSADPRKGVVDPQFRVYGTMNVHVVDASVFPSSITVNPQLTVMALAAYAAEEIAGPPTAKPSYVEPALFTTQAAAPGPGL